MTASFEAKSPISQTDAAAWSGLTEKSDELVKLMRSYFERQDIRRSDDLNTISQAIATAKAEIQATRPLGFDAKGLLGTDAELDAIVRDTESATNTILECAEAVLALDADDPMLNDKVTGHMMRIFEACSFQDITGQRIGKITSLLTRIEMRIGELAFAVAEEMDCPAPMMVSREEERRKVLMLNGPALNGPEVEQAEIDALFA